MLENSTLCFKRRKRPLTNEIVTFILIITWTTALGLKNISSSHVMELIRRGGYSGEEHQVHTQDGYILTVHRILPVAARRLTERKRPVLLQHGIWSSSHKWLEMGPGEALPFLLSEAGYDVWLGNCRGNIISREHEHLSTKSISFWDFSFHEMGEYDLPAVIDYVLNATAVEQIYYIGHSMGTTMFFVMASLRPDMMAKVHSKIALAPIAMVSPIRSYLRVCIGLLGRFLSLILWTDTEIGILSDHGISTKTMLHFSQLYLTGRFTSFDYGLKTNMRRYNIPTPPHYTIADVSVPIAIYYGTDDPFTTEEDMKILSSSLAKVVGMWTVPFDHIEFLAGRNVKRELYESIIMQLHHMSD